VQENVACSPMKAVQDSLAQSFSIGSWDGSIGMWEEALSGYCLWVAYPWTHAVLFNVIMVMGGNVCVRVWAMHNYRQRECLYPSELADVALP